MNKIDKNTLHHEYNQHKYQNLVNLNINTYMTLLKKYIVCLS